MGYRQRGAKWEVNVAHKGERRFATVNSEEEAKEKEIELKAELIRLHRTTSGESPAQSPQPVTAAAPTVTSWTLGEAIAATFEHHWNGTKSAWWYKLKCAALSAHFGDAKRLHEIDTAAMDGFRKEAREVKKWGQATINHHLAALSMVFKVAHQRGGVSMKPVLGIKKATRVRMRYLSDKEEEIMLALLEQRGKADLVDWFKVLIDTGMRPDESRHLSGRWCDFKTGVIHVQPEGGWTPKTVAGIRGIPMTSRVKPILERRCLTYKMGRLFPYNWDVFTNQWDSMREAMGLKGDQDFVPYALRHTFGTRLVQRGVDITLIKDLMGHEDIKQTMQYAKRGAAQYVAAMRVLEPEAKL